MEQVLILKNKISEIALLPAFVNVIGKALAIAPEDCANLNLVLEEVVSNVISYAYPQGGEHELEIRAVCEERLLTLSVTDGGIPFDPTRSKVPDTSLTMDEREVGGLGIFLISQLMDRICYQRENGKNRLTMFKNFGTKG